MARKKKKNSNSRKKSTTSKQTYYSAPKKSGRRTRTEKPEEDAARSLLAKDALTASRRKISTRRAFSRNRNDDSTEAGPLPTNLGEKKTSLILSATTGNYQPQKGFSKNEHDDRNSDIRKREEKNNNPSCKPRPKSTKVNLGNGSRRGFIPWC